MSNFLELKIDNSKRNADKSNKWKDPGAKLYSALLGAHYYEGGIPTSGVEMDAKVKEGKYKQWDSFLKEAYLIAPIDQIKNSPYGVTPFGRSGCKYPHHVIKNGKLVVSVEGVKRAFDMSFYQQSRSPGVNRHLNKHMKELGIEPIFHHMKLYWRESVSETDKLIEDNFLFIENFIYENMGIDLHSPTELFEDVDESIMLEYQGEFSSKIFEEIGRTPKEICTWMQSNISYDKTISGWKLKSPEETFINKTGNCHDQSLFSTFILHSLGFITGQLFFIEYQENNPIGGNSHTLTWYKENKKIYWMENAWDVQAGIHGPYDSIDDLKIDIRSIFLKDNDLNSNKYDGILFGKFSSYKIGYSLGEYVESWKIEDFIENTIQSEDHNDEYYIRELTKDDVNNKHFHDWFFQIDEFINDNPSTFDLDILVYNDSWKNYCYGYFINDKLEGIIRAKYIDSEELYKISFLFVNPRFQGRGIGTTLLKHIISVFGDKKMILGVFADNKPAVGLYKKYGFIITTTVVIEDEPGVDPRFIGKKRYMMERNPIEAIKESYEWIERFVYNDQFRESVNTTETIISSGDLKQYRITDEELNKARGEIQMNESIDDLDWIESYLMEEGEAPPPVPGEEVPTEQPTPEVEKKPESMPQKTDKVESDKNGKRRKNLYIEFIKWCQEYNPKNMFGSIFDPDAFHTAYPFVFDDLRYFYRLANPMLCVLGGNLTFFAVAELRKVNSRNSHLNEMMIFAATDNDFRVFNNKDKKVYRGTDENGALTLHEVLGDTFDTYIQKMINKGDILNAPLEEIPQ